MEFESSQTRKYWFFAVLRSIPDLLVSLIIAQYTSTGWIGFIATLVALKALYALIWLKNSILEWTLYKLYSKKQIVTAIEDELKLNKFPAPKEYEHSVTTYLDSILNNENLPIELKIKAASTIGTINYPAMAHKFQEAMRLNIAYENALKKYKQYLISKEVN